MMGLDERFAYLILGCVIGFVLGYFVRSLKRIEGKVDEVDRVMKKKNERGFMSNRWIADTAMIVVLCLVVFASFKSQKASNEVTESQDAIAKITYCNQEFLSKTITALNERTEYTKEQTDANLELQTSFAEFLRILTFQPPKPEDERRGAFDKYFATLQNFIAAANKTAHRQAQNPYPTIFEFQVCLEKDLEDIQKEVME